MAVFGFHIFNKGNRTPPSHLDRFRKTNYDVLEFAHIAIKFNYLLFIFRLCLLVLKLRRLLVFKHIHNGSFHNRSNCIVHHRTLHPLVEPVNRTSQICCLNQHVLRCLLFLPAFSSSVMKTNLALNQRSALSSIVSKTLHNGHV